MHRPPDRVKLAAALPDLDLEAVRAGESPALAALLENDGQLTPLLCAQAADGGDPAARAICERVGRGLGYLITL